MLALISYLFLDVTPEAISALILRPAPGLALTMLQKSLLITPMAMLSRPVSGIRNSSLIITLPGSPKGACECLSFVLPGLPHALDLLREDIVPVTNTHTAMQMLSSEGIIAKDGESEGSGAIQTKDKGIWDRSPSLPFLSLCLSICLSVCLSFFLSFFLSLPNNNLNISN